MTHYPINPHDLYKEYRQDHVSRYSGTGKVYHHKATAAAAWESAVHNAETMNLWHEYESAGLVRLNVIPDEYEELENLLGDTFDPDANPDINPRKLEQQRKAEIERINRLGVYGIQSEYMRDGEWITADSCWGFIGDDWKESGYDLDVMHAAILEINSMMQNITIALVSE